MPKIFIGVEGKYLWTDKVKLNGETHGIPLNARFRLDGFPLNARFRLDGFFATAVIGVRF
ncbi:MAG: hypothetical protein H6Q48_4913 [Deltaproteobacteria bacterium]|nr:hypothetical protein [Deltaproteobacteria bacterium]